MSTAAIRMKSPTGIVGDVPAFAIADAKKSMTDVLIHAKKQGGVALTRHGRVETMGSRYDRLVRSMQGAIASAAADAVFGPVPARPRGKPKTPAST